MGLEEQSDERQDKIARLVTDKYVYVELIMRKMYVVTQTLISFFHINYREQVKVVQSSLTDIVKFKTNHL